MGEGSVTQSRHLGVIAERDAWKEAASLLYFAVLGMAQSNPDSPIDEAITAFLKATDTSLTIGGQI